jgi:hypothetical protein
MSARHGRRQTLWDEAILPMIECCVPMPEWTRSSRPNGARVGSSCGHVGMVRDHETGTLNREEFMGSKPSHAIPSNRPESGGADRNERQEKSGLLEREKQELAKSEESKREGRRDEGSDRMTGDKGELND